MLCFRWVFITQRLGWEARSLRAFRAAHSSPALHALLWQGQPAARRESQHMATTLDDFTLRHLYAWVESEALPGYEAETYERCREALRDDDVLELAMRDSWPRALGDVVRNARLDFGRSEVAS